MVEFLILAVTPFHPRALVRPFSKGFGQAVGQGLSHQRVVIVIVFFKFCDQRFDVQARGHSEGAEIIHPPGFAGGDEIRHGVAGLLIGSGLLLPQSVEGGEQMARFIGVDFDVFLNAVGREKSDDGARLEQFFTHQVIEKFLTVRK